MGRFCAGGIIPSAKVRKIFDIASEFQFFSIFRGCCRTSWAGRGGAPQGRVLKHRAPGWGSSAPDGHICRVLLLECVFYGVVRNHFFLEHISAGLGALDHLDNFGVGAAFTLLKRCNGFLCHIVELYLDLQLLRIRFEGGEVCKGCFYLISL